MRTLNPPPFNAADVLSKCIGGTDDPVLRGRLRAIERDLARKAGAYEDKARAGRLDLVKRDDVVDGVTADELRTLYSGQMSATRGVARPVYNAIRGAPANLKCPLCGVGTVTVLDHHLPQSKYPDLCVCPLNLVPACDFCNNAKRAKHPSTADEQTINPYFDDYTREQWIAAHLDRDGPPVVVFSVAPPTHWKDVDRKRVKRHFDVVKLGHTYASNANDDMVTLRDHLALIALTKGSPGLVEHLHEQAGRYRARLNSWQHVMYAMLAANTWFCDGGYRLIGA